MSDKSDPNESQDDMQLFMQEVDGIKPLRQDKIAPIPPSSKRKLQNRDIETRKIKERRKIRASFEFSDGFEAHFDLTQPLKYARDKTYSGEVKRLRRGEYPPDMTLDLHGYNRENAKWEIAEFLHEAKKRNFYCICIVHGIGSRVLKQHIPNWLVQHPDVMGFHEAPLEWGGKGALLVILPLPEHLRL